MVSQASKWWSHVKFIWSFLLHSSVHMTNKGIFSLAFNDLSKFFKNTKYWWFPGNTRCWHFEVCKFYYYLKNRSVVFTQTKIHGRLKITVVDYCWSVWMYLFLYLKAIFKIGVSFWIGWNINKCRSNFQTVLIKDSFFNFLIF